MDRVNILQRRPTGWRRNRSVLLAVILTAQLMVVLDATIVNVALPHIQRSLDFSSSALSWVLNAYVLTFGGLLLLGARTGDLLGRRRTFLAGIGLFSLSSLAGGFATTGWMLLGARALQGVGGALAAPAALALLTTIFPEGSERVRAIGLFTTVSAAGGATGLVAGGLLTQWASWRWVMFVNVPIGLAVIIVGASVLVETQRRPRPLRPGRRGDVHGGHDGAWYSASWRRAPPGGALPSPLPRWWPAWPCWACSFGIEAAADEPILPLRILTSPIRASANVARGLGYAGMYGMVFFLTQFLQDIQHHSALVTGIGFLPTPITVFLSSQLTSRVLVNRVPAKVLMLSGSALSTLGLLLCTQLDTGTPYPQLLVSLVLIGAGMGISFVSLTSAALTGVAPEDAGAASGLVNVMQQLGAALGLAVLVTVFNSVTRSSHTARLGSIADASARATLVHGLDITFAAAAVFSLAALSIVAYGIRTSRQPEVPAEPELELEAAA